MQKNLIIDGQILQTPAWYRGMGKYTLQVLHELSQSSPEDTRLTIIFNSALDCDDSRFKTVQFLCPRIDQVQLDLPLPATKNATSKSYRKALETAIDSRFSGQDNYYLIASPFYLDFFADFPSNCHKQLLVYDLIPLLFWSELGGYFPPDIYMERFKRILEADTIFSISATTRRDLIKVFGLPPEMVVNINGGFIKIAETAKKPTNFKIPKRYILFPTGDLPHKNNALAVAGFEKYSQASQSGLPLLITSFFHEQSKEALLALSNNIIFTDNIADEEMEYLFEHAEVILFASKYEGLGMPILDAVAGHKPVVTSRIAVFEEMSKDAFYYFDHKDSDDLAQALVKAVRHEGLPAKTRHYPRILEKYTWASTCQTIVRSLQPKVRLTGAVKKPHIAVACIYPGIAGQIGRLAEALHYSLSEDFIVDYFFDSNGYHYREMERPSFLDFISQQPQDISKLDIHRYRRYKGVIYLLDDAVLPSRLAQRAAVMPGIALTDFQQTAKLSESQQQLKDLMCDNQYGLHKLTVASYDDNQKTTTFIKTELAKIQATPLPATMIIRQGHFKRSIIEKLKAL